MSKEKPNRLNERLNALLEVAEKQPITLRQLIHSLEGKGQAVLLIIIGLPFCLPIQIPGLAIPFGIFLAFVGLRIAFGHRLWIPAALLDKKISYDTLQKITHYAGTITDRLRGFSYTRMVWLVQTPSLHILHGLTITLLALLLALPIPIPFTNIAAACPIVCFGLALLDDDGVLICLAYFLAILAVIIFAALIWLSIGGWHYFMG